MSYCVVFSTIDVMVNGWNVSHKMHKFEFSHLLHSKLKFEKSWKITLFFNDLEKLKIVKLVQIQKPWTQNSS